jgi:hypothetical protein
MKDIGERIVGVRCEYVRAALNNLVEIRVSDISLTILGSELKRIRNFYYLQLQSFKNEGQKYAIAIETSNGPRELHVSKEDLVIDNREEIF